MNKSNNKGLIRDTIMWVLITIVLMFYPAITIFYMVYTREEQRHYLTAPAQGYFISGLFLFCGVVMMYIIIRTAIDSMKD